MNENLKVIPRFTRNSAFAEWPRDASCLSVVTVTYLERSLLSLHVVASASDLPMRSIKLCSVDFGVTSRHVINKIH